MKSENTCRCYLPDYQTNSLTPTPVHRHGFEVIQACGPIKGQTLLVCVDFSRIHHRPLGIHHAKAHRQILPSVWTTHGVALVVDPRQHGMGIAPFRFAGNNVPAVCPAKFGAAVVAVGGETMDSFLPLEVAVGVRFYQQGLRDVTQKDSGRKPRAPRPKIPCIFQAKMPAADFSKSRG